MSLFNVRLPKNPDSPIEQANRAIYIVSNCFSRTNEFVSATHQFSVGAGLAPALSLLSGGGKPRPYHKNAPRIPRFIRSEQSLPNPTYGFRLN